MAVTTVAEQAIAGPYLGSASTQLTVVTFTAGVTDGIKCVMSKKRVLALITNTGASSGTVTVASKDDAYGRTQPITSFSIAASAYVARIFEAPGWEQTLGGRDLLFTPSATTIEFLFIPLD